MFKKILQGSRFRALHIIMTVALVLPMVILPAGKVAADDHFLHDETVTIGDGAAYTVHALDEGYNNNVYLSLKDMAVVLTGTQAAFSIDYIDGTFVMISGGNGNMERALNGWTDEEREIYKGKSLGSNDLTFDDTPRKYYTIRATYGDETDCFMSMINLAMLLDTNIYVSGKNSIAVEPGKRFVISPQELEGSGFFMEVNSVLVGDATTGQVFYEYEGDKVFPIASTTKLMTCLLAEEAIAKGSISEDTMITLSEEAERISQSADGAIEMTAGNQAPVSELLMGALLPSSNECALALAEGIAGSEEAFVQMMNSRAAELSMNTAIFYNSNGLPAYNVEGIPCKRQNMMSAEDMFRLCSYIVTNCPQIKAITSTPMAYLSNLHKDITNTNSLLYNMPEITGLKTGTTTKAGACLVTSLTVNDGTMDHELVVVELGAEGSKARFTTSELMARYAKKIVTGEQSASGVALGDSSVAEDGAEDAQPKAISAEALVNMVVNGAFRLGMSQGE